MEDLEPWNMFTNDFAPEEADGNECFSDGNKARSLKDNLSSDEDDDDMEKDEEENDGEDDKCLLVPEVSMTGENENCGSDNGNFNDLEDDEPGEDDNTIFNFDIEQQTKISERPKRTPKSAKEIPNVKKELESLINYDEAIIFICPACGFEFDTHDLWKRHMNGVHSYNTRQGLNFVQVDKLYHECRECFKRIAMHSMENLLKHKYTHLPYRCSKCKYCHRQYKYRQDLTVHLRTQHYDDLIDLVKNAKNALEQPQEQASTTNGGGLEIKDIKENAVDIFESTYGDNDAINVKNELMEQYETDMDATAEHSKNSLVLPAFLEDGLSCGSSNNSDRPSYASGIDGDVTEEQVLLEKQIQYICPECGQEYGTHHQWEEHIISAHNFGTRRGLNFQEINSNQHARCLECNKVMTANVIQQLQQHKFTHLPYKTWLRCKLCFKAFIGRTEILKHLRFKHRFGGENNNSSKNTMSPGNLVIDDDGDDSQDIWECDDSLLSEDQKAPSKKKKTEIRDTFDRYIDYLCPTCGKEFLDKKQWRKHIVHVHKLTTLEILNFKNINEREVMCLECSKVITNAYGIQNAQQHYFTHMPFKSFIRCRLCGKSYTDRKGLIKHLRGKHGNRIKVQPPSSTNTMLQSLYKGTQSQLPTPRLLQQPNPKSHTRQPQDNQLLSRALQRPLREWEKPLPSQFPPKNRHRKEIVTRNNFVYEIEFLDDDDECDMDVGIINAAEEDDDVLLVPEISNASNGGRSGGERCPDCGSIFSSSESLRVHIREEHEFYDKSSDHYGASKTDNFYNDASAENSNDDVLLMRPIAAPTDNFDTSFTSASSSSLAALSQIDHHFTYLCPACGVEHYTQMDWRRHINSVHNFDKRQYLNFRQLDQLRYQCTICQDILAKSKLKSLQDHKFRHLPYKSYLKCKYCGTLYNHKPNMYGHLQVRHNIYNSVCAAKSFANEDAVETAPPRQKLKQILQKPNSSTALSGNSRQISSKYASSSTHLKPPGLKTVEDVITFHNAVDHATITYFCPACNENFDSHVFWRKHIVEEHNLNSREGLNFRQIDEHHFLCLQCYKRVTVTHTKGAIGQLQSHKFRHLPFKSFKCLSCKGEFVRKQMFFKHLNRATNRCEGSTQTSANTSTGDATETTRTEHSKPDRENGRNRLAEIEENATNFGSQDHEGNLVLTSSQEAYVLLCPQCGQEFDSQRNWREHINLEHDLRKRDKLRFKKLKPNLHKCLDCREHVNGRKLRDLQIHRFKHLPYGTYIKCKFCSTGYNHIKSMHEHLRQKHPNVIQKNEDYEKIEDMRLYEDCSLLDSDSMGESPVINEAEMDDAVQVVPDETDDEEQYLLG